MWRSWYSIQEEAKAKVEVYRAEAALAQAQAQPSYLLRRLRTLADRFGSPRQGQPKHLGR